MITPLSYEATARERAALAAGQAYLYRGRVIPVIRGGDGSDGGGDGGGGDGSDGGGDGGGDGGDGGGEDKPKTFSQGDLDRIVKDRLAREAKKYEGFDDLKTKAEKYDELEQANASELDKATKRAEKAEQEAAKAKETANRRLIEAAVLAEGAKQKAVRPEHLARLIDTERVTVGDDGQVTGAEEAVKVFLEANPEYVGGKANAGDADQGARGGGAKQLSADALKNMSPDEIVKARKEGRLANVLSGS